MVERGARAWRDAQIEGAWDAYKLFVNERQAEPWTDEHEGLSARKMQRATYSLGSRGKDDLGELDRRVLLLTAGTDVGAHGLYTEFVAWGIQPKTGQVMCWGLQYRITGGTPTDDLDTPEMWGAYFRLLENSVWRHAALPGCGWGCTRCWWTRAASFSLPCGMARKEIRSGHGRAPRRDVASLRGGGPAVLRQPSGDRREPDRPLARKPTAVPAARRSACSRRSASTPDRLKDTVYDMAQRDQRLPEGAPKQMVWPVDLEARGYTDAYFREYGNEVRYSKFTPKGGWGYPLGPAHRQGEDERGVGLPDLRDGRGADEMRAGGQHGPPDRALAARAPAGRRQREPLDRGRDGRPAEALGHSGRFGLRFRR